MPINDSNIIFWKKFEAQKFSYFDLDMNVRI